MPLLPFLAYTTVGSLLWNAALIGAGYVLGARWHVVERSVGEAADVVYVVLGVVLVALVVKRVRSRRAHRREQQRTG
jgi:membrane protein DedA with SNARE-associated domain